MKFVRMILVSWIFALITGCAMLAPTPRPPTPTVERINATPAPYVTETPVPTRVPTLTPTIAPLAGVATQFEAARALEHVRTLSEKIGARPAGSDTSERAGDYIFNQLGALGYTVEWQSFKFEQWINRNTILELTAPTKRKLEGAPFFYSSAGGADAEIAFVPGTGAPSDYAKVDVNGRIALVQRGTLSFFEKVRNAERAGATAILIYNSTPGAFGGTLGQPSKIPAIALTGSEGKAILDALTKGAVIGHIASDTGIEPRTARNVVATKAGTADRILVIGGHYDSVEVGKGAVDNGSGIGVLLELARLFSKRQMKHTLHFVAFDAEELGLYGSKEYVDTLPDDTRQRMDAMLNFDMLGGGEGPLLAAGNGRAGKFARDLAKSVGIDARDFSMSSGAGSDHLPFEAIGIDTVFFSREYNLLHTEQDTLTQVKPEFLLEAGRVGAMVLEKLDAQ